MRRVWEAADRPCGKRLAPFLRELVGALERRDEVSFDPVTRAQLVRLAPATLEQG